MQHSLPMWYARWLLSKYHFLWSYYMPNKPQCIASAGGRYKIFASILLITQTSKVLHNILCILEKLLQHGCLLRSWQDWTLLMDCKRQMYIVTKSTNCKNGNAFLFVTALTQCHNLAHFSKSAKSFLSVVNGFNLLLQCTLEFPLACGISTGTAARVGLPHCLNDYSYQHVIEFWMVTKLQEWLDSLQRNNWWLDDDMSHSGI